MVTGGQFLMLEGKYDPSSNPELETFTETIYSGSHFLPLNRRQAGKFVPLCFPFLLGLNF